MKYSKLIVPVWNDHCRSVMNDESDAGGGGPERPAARPLLPELAQYLHWSGLCQPLRQIYVAVAAAEAPYAAHLVALFAVAQAHRWVYSGRAGRLVAAARRPADAVDTAPFVAGLATLLRHLGHEASRTCVRLLIQFVRWQLETSARSVIEFCSMYFPYSFRNVLKPQSWLERAQCEMPMQSSILNQVKSP